MFASDQYQLIDFGEGRKLERFGAYLLDRPSPAADGFVRLQPARWKQATARFRRGRGVGEGSWTPRGALPETWTLRHEAICLELKATPFGHVGVFAEQADNWEWLAVQVRRLGRIKVLNLFAYTGGATLTAAAAGAEVVHVDAARNVLAWARRNAKLSGLGQAKIRWICEDAARFVARERRRGNRYQAIILDPPSYGHGPKGEPWKLDQHLPQLLADCRQLIEGPRGFLILTCHSPGYGPAELEALFADAVHGHCRGGAVAKELVLRDTQGRALRSGVRVINTFAGA